MLRLRPFYIQSVVKTHCSCKLTCLMSVVQTIHLKPLGQVSLLATMVTRKRCCGLITCANLKAETSKKQNKKEMERMDLPVGQYGALILQCKLEQNHLFLPALMLITNISHALIAIQTLICLLCCAGCFFAESMRGHLEDQSLLLRPPLFTPHG